MITNIFLDVFRRKYRTGITISETEKKTSDQEADDLKDTGREGIQLAKELGQAVKKSAGNNAGSLSESEKGEGIPASLQGGKNPLDLSHTKDASSITGDSATTERGRKSVGQGMLPDRNSSPQNGGVPQKRGEIPKPQRGTSLQGAKKTANASGAALVELFFGDVSSGQGSVLLDADENGIPRVPYIHQGFGVYDFTANSYTHTEILSHSFPDGCTFSAGACGYCCSAMAVSYIAGHLVLPTDFEEGGSWMGMWLGAATHDVRKKVAARYGIETREAQSIDDAY